MMQIDTYTLHRGTAPLLISMPHVGTRLPPDLAARMLPVAQQVDDTDWHLEQLYEFARAMGASMLVPVYSRYVIDLNRPRDNANLYPGQDTTGLCPLDTFAKQALYASGNAPDEAEMAARVPVYWQPYHTALGSELARIKAEHGRALLWEAHSIRSEVPRFFAGRLPDFNLGTANGAACAAGLGEALLAVAQANQGYSAVLNGRFQGGHITRHYGQPAHGIQAVQLELSQRTYMQEAPPYTYQPALAGQVQPLLRQLLQTMLDFVA